VKNHEMAVVYFDGELWRVVKIVPKNDSLWIRIGCAGLLGTWDCLWS
jgi:hypothetical protein